MRSLLPRSLPFLNPKDRRLSRLDPESPEAEAEADRWASRQDDAEADETADARGDS